MELIEMETYFDLRKDIYDENQIQNMDGGNTCYIELVKCIPEGTKNILDIGCGTGLELQTIWDKLPETCITGVDFSQGMLSKLHEKYPNRNITTVCKDFFEFEYKKDCYDVVLSVMTMHHFEPNLKIKLYKKFLQSLKEGGVYIEGDYMAPTQEYEEFFFSRKVRFLELMGNPKGFFHYDTPCTVENQKKMLHQTGFRNVYEFWKQDKTSIIVGEK